MYLSDLTFIEDGNMLRSDFDQSLVHYSKWKLAANVIQKIQSLQRLGYVFEELPSIQMWLASVRYSIQDASRTMCSTFVTDLMAQLGRSVRREDPLPDVSATGGPWLV